MKWKRSRKAQQESKNKDKNEEKLSRSDRSSNANQSIAFKNGNSEKNGQSNSFHFPKSIDPNNHLPPTVLHQRHLNSLPGSSKDLMSSNADENYANLMNRPQPNVFNDQAEDMIWRVV